LAKLFLAYPTYVSKACHARYRQHASSTSAKARTSGEYDRHRAHGAQDAFFDWLAGYVPDHGGDLSLVAAIDRARARSRRTGPGRFRLLLWYLRRKLPVR
jgi:hypothetical protein